MTKENKTCRKFEAQNRKHIMGIDGIIVKPKNHSQHEVKPSKGVLRRRGIRADNSQQERS